MEKKRENILFPLGFNGLSITTMAYSMHLKAEIKEDFDQKLKQLESDLREKITEELESKLEEKIRQELESKLRENIKDIYNELYEKLSEKIRRDDGWENVETEKVDPGPNPEK